jgi:RNA polymerase sigma factor (sigma-70 family)
VAPFDSTIRLAGGAFDGEHGLSSWDADELALPCDGAGRDDAFQPTVEAYCSFTAKRAGSLGQPEAEYAALQSLRATTTAMAQLTVEQRVPLLLRQVDGLTYTEIAEVLGASMTAVKSRLNRARVELARELDDAR